MRVEAFAVFRYCCMTPEFTKVYQAPYPSGARIGASVEPTRTCIDPNAMRVLRRVVAQYPLRRVMHRNQDDCAIPISERASEMHRVEL